MADKITLDGLLAFDPSPRKTGANWRFLCPECGTGKPADDTHRSFRVEVNQGYYKCHRCGLKGMLDREKKVLTQEERAALEAKRRLEQEAAQAEQKRRWRVARAALLPVEGSDGEAYLVGRALSAETISSCQVKYAAKFFGRPAVVFPKRNAFTGNLVAMQARYIDNREGALRMMTIGPGKDALFETPGCWTSDKVIITEAPIDAMSLLQMGHPALATCGPGLPSWLPDACRGKTVILAPDNDPGDDSPGEKMARKWSTIFAAKGIVAYRWKPELKDWNDVLKASKEGRNEQKAL